MFLVWFLQSLAESLLANSLGKACRQLTVDHGPSALQEVLVHYRIVLQFAKISAFGTFFRQMFQQTNRMKVRRHVSQGGFMESRTCLPRRLCHHCHFGAAIPPDLDPR